jgi:ABC-type sugar transport system ATPase subunit
MADRVAVMDQGRVQQVATPEELYHRPANRFVAEFIGRSNLFEGSPAMNLLPSALVGIGGDGQLAGFRPEHVRLGNGSGGAASYDAVVEVVEYLGDEQLAHLRVHDASLVAKLPVEPRLLAGSEATFSVPHDKVLLFDAESRRAVGTTL